MKKPNPELYSGIITSNIHKAQIYIPQNAFTSFMSEGIAEVNESQMLFTYVMKCNKYLNN